MGSEWHGEGRIEVSAKRRKERREDAEQRARKNNNGTHPS